MRLPLLFFFVLVYFIGTAQPQKNLVAYFSFDDCAQLAKETRGDTLQDGILRGNAECNCGVYGDDNSLELDGQDDRVNFIGPLVREFNIIDFSVSFYFKPFSNVGTQDLISKIGPSCSAENAFSIKYQPRPTPRIVALLSENASKQVELTAPINPDACWQHVVVVRKQTDFILYLNGEQVGLGRTSTRADIENTAPFSISNSPCLNSTDVPFKGLVDELRIYNRDLTRDEVTALYVRPDMIQNRDTIIVLGDTVSTRITASCASSFTWTPVEGVANPKSPTTTIAPPSSGVQVYTLNFDDGNCVAKDTLTINVVNPDELDCSALFLPNAFTPNADNVNDAFGISNPFVIENLVSFEVFDRWGARMFLTTEPLGKWNGTFKSQIVDPGVFFYKVIYTCQGAEQVKTGNVTVMR